jgi:hypothetical protein
MKQYLVALGLLAAGAAHAQTYDLDISISDIATPFTGSFNYNSSGTGYCSTPFCGSGITPDFTNINISGPNGAMFTGVNKTSSGGLDFYAASGPLGLLSSEVFQLSFNTNSPLGGSASSIGVSNIVYNVDSNVTGLYQCGQDGISCTASLSRAPAAAVPEIDASTAVTALSLLAGALAVCTARRRHLAS